MGAICAPAFAGANRTSYYALFMAVACAIAVGIAWQILARPARITLTRT